MWWSILYYYVNVQHQAQSYMNYYCRACTSQRCPGATLQIQPFRNCCRDNWSSESVDDQAGIVLTCTSSCAKAWARQRPSSTSRPTHPRRLKHATDCGGVRRRRGTGKCHGFARREGGDPVGSARRGCRQLVAAVYSEVVIFRVVYHPRVAIRCRPDRTALSSRR